MADFTDPNSDPEINDSDSDTDNKDNDFTTSTASKNTSRRGSYNKPLRAEAMRQIRRMLVEQGASHGEIMSALKIPSRTFYRYLGELFYHDRMLLISKESEVECLNQMILCEQRLLKQRQDILDQIANNPKADWKARVAAHHLCGEISCVLVCK